MTYHSNYTTGQQVALTIRARKMALRVFVPHEETDWELVKKYSKLVAGFCGLLVQRFRNPIQRQFVALTRIFRARHRQPVRRSAAKSGGDDGGGDGDSDQGEPPRPSYTGRIILPAPIQARQFLLTHKPNSLSLSRIVHPCRWPVLGRWAA